MAVRELSGVLTNKKIALRLKGRIYAACVQSAMLYGSETWAANTAQVARLSRAEMRMVICMCGVSLRERKTNAEQTILCVLPHLIHTFSFNV